MISSQSGGQSIGYHLQQDMGYLRSEIISEPKDNLI
jgi:hypothetical protein